MMATSASAATTEMTAIMVVDSPLPVLPVVGAGDGVGDPVCWTWVMVGDGEGVAALLSVSTALSGCAQSAPVASVDVARQLAQLQQEQHMAVNNIDVCCVASSIRQAAARGGCT
jgi:hypothetical protein